MRAIPTFFALAFASASTTHASGGAPDGLVRVRVEPTSVVARVSDDFIGFGYETSAVARAGFFSPKDATLVRLYRTLSGRGLVRIGGNVSDYTHYTPAGAPQARPQGEATLINRAELDELAAFLRATGWTAMWGLNLKTGSKEEAVEEALAVDAALGDRLHSFEIGNEVDLQPGFENRFDKFLQAYRDYKAAIRTALPKAVFSGPDSARDTDWTVGFAAAEGHDVRMLTQHYYRSRASNPIATLPTLLADDAGWDAKLGRLRDTASKTGLPFRINEVNSFSGGGKPGVSDTFGGALWCLDYMLQLATSGCEGINVETDVNQFGWVSHYSPIFRDAKGVLHARPEYYGMLAFSLAAKGELLKVSLDRPVPALRIYAARPSPNDIWVTVLNKDMGAGVDVEMSVPEGYTAAGAYALRAPSVTSEDQVTLAGTQVAPDGSWSPGPLEPVISTGGSATVSLPDASAKLILLSRKQ